MADQQVQTFVPAEFQIMLGLCSGQASINRATDQLMQLDARIDRLKQELYFPAVQGYK